MVHWAILIYKIKARDHHRSRNTIVPQIIKNKLERNILRFDINQL